MRTEIKINDKDMAFMSNRLHVPMIVRDILQNPGHIQDDIQYGLHEVISNLQPDSALLCIALAAKQIAASSNHSSTSLTVLSLECNRIISEYGPLWIENAQDQDNELDEAALAEILVHIPEDLESFSELLMMNSDFLRDTNEKAAEICDILQIQADAQALIAEEFVSVFNAAGTENPEPQNIPEGIGYADLTETPITLKDNVIQFPSNTE